MTETQKEVRSQERLSAHLFALGAAAPFFRAAHRAFIIAASFALPAAVIPPPLFFLPAFAAFGVDALADDLPFAFAHLAL